MSASPIIKPRRNYPVRLGPRPGSIGRVKFTTRLRPATIAFLRELGRGKANVGIERVEEIMRGFVSRAVTKRGLRGKA